MNFNLNDYKDDNIAMHCKTEEEARDFCQFLHENGRKWCSEVSYTFRTNWDGFKERTIYFFNQGTFGAIDGIFVNKNTIILEWSDFMRDTFTRANLKNGDVIKRRNGWVEIICLETGACITKNGFNLLSDIRDDLTDKMGEDYDIVAVRRPLEPYDCQFCAFEHKFGELVYERKEVEEMTLEEVCKALGKEIKIVKEH